MGCLSQHGNYIGALYWIFYQSLSFSSYFQDDTAVISHPFLKKSHSQTGSKGQGSSCTTLFIRWKFFSRSPTTNTPSVPLSRTGSYSLSSNNHCKVQWHLPRTWLQVPKQNLYSANSKAFDWGSQQGLSETLKVIGSDLPLCRWEIGQWFNLSESQRTWSSRRYRTSICFLLLLLSSPLQFLLALFSFSNSQHQTDNSCTFRLILLPLITILSIATYNVV